MKTLPSRAYSMGRPLPICQAIVPSSWFCDQARSGPGVEQQEAAGAVGRLRLARQEAGLPEQGRLLIPRHARHRHAGRDRPAGRPSPPARRRRAPRRGASPRGRAGCSAGRAAQAPLSMSRSRVREALETSVRCTAPPVRFHRSQRIDRPEDAPRPPRPAPAGPGRAPAATPAWCPRSRRPAPAPCAPETGPPIPAARSSSQRRAVRRHCQTMAGPTGSPLRRSQTTVVSR